METRRKIIIDTDIGDDIDDAFAILLAVLSEKFEILGVTTVFRSSLHRGRIAKALLESAGADVPVYAGADEPIDGTIPTFPFEDADADGKPAIPHYLPEMEEERTEKAPAENFILDMADLYPEEVSIVALAPLTNLAKAAKKRPDSFRKIKEIFLMGGDGTFHFAEWNVRCDCAAAKTVFDFGVDILLCGFDITSSARLSGEDVTRLRALRAAPFRLLVKMMDKYISDYREERVPTMHDPLALCMLLLPEKFVWEKKKLTVSLKGGTRGMLCACDGGREKSIVVKADWKGLIAYMLERFLAYDATMKEKA